MKVAKQKQLSTLLILTFGSFYQYAESYADISVDLSDYLPEDTFTKYYHVEYPETTINVTVNSNVSFFVLQVHTFRETVTLTYSDSVVKGTNIGLVWQKDSIGKKTHSTMEDFSIFLLSRSQIMPQYEIILLVITPYTSDYPIPGGCNLSFETETAPYQKINLTDETIIVMSQPASLPGKPCSGNNITTKFYYLYLSDNSSDEYFNGIEKMSTVESITKYGREVPYELSHFKQIYDRYTGTGRIFALVSTFDEKRSAYVPSVSYGCNVHNWDEDCVGPAGVHWKWAIAVLLIAGNIVCFGGHRFFRMSLFFAGSLFGSIFVEILVEIYDDFSSEGKAVFSISVGLLFGIAWLFVWRVFGIPVVSVLPAFILSGLLGSSILFYNRYAFYVYMDDLTFWMMVAVTTLLCLMPVLFLRPLAHIVALSFLGSYSTIVALNYYIGGNLPYIFINTYRRMAVKDFGMAVIDPPYQVTDVCHTVLWALLFGIGIYVQHKYSLGKPPFPPHKNVRQISPASETTPLLHSEEPVPFI